MNHPIGNTFQWRQDRMYFIHKAVPTSLTSQDFAIACAKEVADMSMDTF